jgi:hypothetical protein
MMNISPVEWLLPTLGNDLPVGGNVTELVLLLPSWEAAALEEEARRQGLTTGRMLRRLVRNAIRPDGPGAVGGEP